MGAMTTSEKIGMAPFTAFDTIWRKASVLTYGGGKILYRNLVFLLRGEFFFPLNSSELVVLILARQQRYMLQ